MHDEICVVRQAILLSKGSHSLLPYLSTKVSIKDEAVDAIPQVGTINGVLQLGTQLPRIPILKSLRMDNDSQFASFLYACSASDMPYRGSYHAICHYGHGEQLAFQGEEKHEGCVVLDKGGVHVRPVWSCGSGNKRSNSTIIVRDPMAKNGERIVQQKNLPIFTHVKPGKVEDHMRAVHKHLFLNNPKVPSQTRTSSQVSCGPVSGTTNPKAKPKIKAPPVSRWADRRKTRALAKSSNFNKGVADETPLGPLRAARELAAFQWAHLPKADKLGIGEDEAMMPIDENLVNVVVGNKAKKLSGKDYKRKAIKKRS